MEDLHALGRLVLCLATGNASAARRDLLQQSMNYVNQHYSMDMKNLIRHVTAFSNQFTFFRAT